MRYLLSVCCVGIGLCAGSPSYAADNQTVCRRFIDSMHSRADTTFHDAHMSFAQKRSKLSRLFEEGVDTAWVAQYVAGTYWNTANEQQRQKFVSAYRDYLSNKYIGALSEEDINSMWNFTLVDFKSAAPDEYQAHVNITQKSDEPINLDLRMAENPAGVCHVHDFTVEGVSLQQSQREQIQSLAAKGGLAYVTQRLVDLVQNLRGN